MSIPVHCAHTRLVDPNKLKPNPVNPNRHSAHQIQLLASIIIIFFLLVYLNSNIFCFFIINVIRDSICLSTN